MASVPLKPEYRPTLGQLLAPRWQASSAAARRLVVAALCALVALAFAAVLTLEPASYSHGGPVPFHFSYRGLYRTAPPPGAYVSLTRTRAGGLQDSFTVWPLQLPPYSGSATAALPLYAASHIAGLERRYSGFVLLEEGKTRVNSVPAYTIFYTVQIDGRRMDARDVLLLQQRSGARRGVLISMLSAPGRHADSALEVGNEGVLKRPLHGFEIG